jgi:hypothetical protein
MRVVVVGAGGILAPAAAALAARGDEVTGVALSCSGIPGGVVSLVADAREPATFAGRRFDAGIVYLPAVTPESLAALADAVAGPVVRVATSSGADPALGDVVTAPWTLQLGWHEGRWHTPAEVSDAALEVLADGRGRVLGSVRPWEDRPT